MLRAVIFDLYETLITEWGHEKLTKRQTAAMLGIPYEAFAAETELLHEAQYRGQIPYEESLRSVCRKIGADVSEEAFRRVTEKRRATKAACFASVHEGIVPMLTELRARGLRTAILSNCSAEEVAALGSSVLTPLFDAVIFSYETGLCKPDPAIYRLAAARLGVSPAECLFIGDGGSCELYGAAEAGMRACRALWYIRAMPHPIKEMPFPALDSPADVPGAAERIHL